jgi:hypothetical protein
MVAATISAPPRARVLGASVPGPRHVRRGEECQDAHATAVTADGSVVIAVADGLGSAPAAALGAQTGVAAAATAVRTFWDAAPDASPGSVVEHGLHCARIAIAREATAAGLPLRDLACTMIVAVASDRGACAAHLGDGAVVVQTEGLHVMSYPAPSEYLEVTDPLTADDWRAHVRISRVVHDVRAIAVFTDGVQHAALHADGTPGEAFWFPLLDFARRDGGEHGSDALASLLAGPKLCEHSDDDKTLVITVRP